MEEILNLIIKTYAKLYRISQAAFLCMARYRNTFLFAYKSLLNLIMQFSLQDITLGRYIIYHTVGTFDLVYHTVGTFDNVYPQGRYLFIYAILAKKRYLPRVIYKVKDADSVIYKISPILKGMIYEPQLCFPLYKYICLRYIVFYD